VLDAYGYELSGGRVLHLEQAGGGDALQPGGAHSACESLWVGWELKRLTNPSQTTS